MGTHSKISLSLSTGAPSQQTPPPPTAPTDSPASPKAESTKSPLAVRLKTNTPY